MNVWEVWCCKYINSTLIIYTIFILCNNIVLKKTIKSYSYDNSSSVDDRDLFIIAFYCAIIGAFYSVLP